MSSLRRFRPYPAEEASVVVAVARQVYSEVGFIAFKWMVNCPTPIIIEPRLSGQELALPA